MPRACSRRSTSSAGIGSIFGIPSGQMREPQFSGLIIRGGSTMISRSKTSTNLDRLKEQFVRLRGNYENPPDASIVVPVNAQGDLENVLQLLADIAKYTGRHALEVV